MTLEDLALVEWAVAHMSGTGPVEPPPDPRRESPIPQQGIARLRELVRRLRMEDASTYASSLPLPARVSG